jgi:hypothetical protein
MFRSHFLLTTSTFILTLILVSVSAMPQKIYAGGTPGEATLGQQILQTAELRISSLQTTLAAANTGISAAVDTQMLARENLLNGIVWAVSKQMVSNMTRSLINWINSGFNGSPAFVTDLEGFLKDTLDQAAGEYIESLGGVGEFICSPFRLDVQAALAVNYAQSSSGMPPSCTLTEIGDNLEGFLSGTMDSWDQWIQVTSNPQNTPYGAYLAAEAELNARLVNAEGQELAQLNWGAGFLSNKVCEAIEGESGDNYGQTQGNFDTTNASAATAAAQSDTTQGNCTITTPGHMISERLNEQLGTGEKILIEADEVNELIGALVAQLANQAVTGINGLLGLSSGTGYTNYAYEGSTGSSYVDAAAADATELDYTSFYNEMIAARKLERSFITLIDDTIDDARDVLGLPALTSTSSNRQRQATSSKSTNSSLDDDDLIAALDTVITDANNNRVVAVANEEALDDLIRAYNQASTTATTTVALNLARQEVILDYIALKSSGTLTTAALIETKRIEWGRVIEDV